MHEPVDNAEDAVREHGRRWVAIVIPAAVAAPFSLYLVLALLGVGASRFSKTAGGCCLNLGSAWAGGPGLGVALLIFAVLFVVSIAIADVCWLGPAAVLTQDNEDNKYIAYYLNCEGENPLDVDVSAMSDAVDSLEQYTKDLEALGVCTGLDSAVATIGESLDTLEDSVDEITDEVLSCKYIQPIMGDVLATKPLQVWVVVLAGGCCVYAALLLMPFALAAFNQQGAARVDPEAPAPQAVAVAKVVGAGASADSYVAEGKVVAKQPGDYAAGAPAPALP
ncbi:hypothetical protein JL720_7869 [Aureococcus anophagefferens]|nr:hypothetical protein JL720_7869 [Aureococcus anophagefferens]